MSTDREAHDAAIAREAASLARWLDASRGIRGTKPVWRGPVSSSIRSFWDALGYAPALAQVIADPDAEHGRRQLDELLAQWRADGEPGGAATLPGRWRLVELGETSVLLTDEDAEPDDPPVCVLVDGDATLHPAWRSYLQRASAGVLTMIVRGYATLTVVIRPSVGSSPLPMLAPTLRQLAPEVWLVPGALEDGAPARVAAYRGLDELVDALVELDDDDIVDLPALPVGARFELDADVLTTTLAGLRSFDVPGARVWIGRIEHGAVWCRQQAARCTVVVDPERPLARRLGELAAGSALAAASDSRPAIPRTGIRLDALRPILSALRGEHGGSVAVDRDAPACVQAMQQVLGGLARPLAVLAPQLRIDNEPLLAACVAGWSPAPRIPVGARLLRSGDGWLRATDETGGDDDPPLVELVRGRAEPQPLPIRYTELVSDLALRMAFTDGPHMGWIDLVAAPPCAAVPGLHPRIARLAPQIWQLDPGPAAAQDARRFHGFVELDAYLAWIAGLDDLRARDAWTPRADRVVLAGFDRARAEHHGLRIVTLERAANPLLQAAFGPGFAAPLEQLAVGRLFGAWVWVRLDVDRAAVSLDPRARPAFVAAATAAREQVLEQSSWQQLATNAYGSLALG